MKNGEDLEGGWSEREFQEESDEGPVKVWCWTRVAIGRGTVNEKIKRAEALRVEGIMRRGRQRLRWEDCV